MISKIQKDKLWNKNFLLAMLVSATVALANGMFSPALPIYAQIYGITTAVIGSVLSLSLFLSMIGRFVVGGLSTNHSKKMLVMVSLVTILLSYLFFFFATNVYLITVAKVLQAVGSGMNITVLSTLAFANLPESRLGEGIGIFSLAGSLAQVIAPMLGTILAKNHQFFSIHKFSRVNSCLHFHINMD